MVEDHRFGIKYQMDLNAVSQESLMDIDRGFQPLCSKKEMVFEAKMVSAVFIPNRDPFASIFFVILQRQ